jgi:hypothetical protein
MIEGTMTARIEKIPFADPKRGVIYGDLVIEANGVTDSATLTPWEPYGWNWREFYRLCARIVSPTPAKPAAKRKPAKKAGAKKKVIKDA